MAKIRSSKAEPTSRHWTITATCTGTIRETWRVRTPKPVTAAEARELFEEASTEENGCTLDCIEETTEDEHDREVDSVEVYDGE